MTSTHSPRSLSAPVACLVCCLFPLSAALAVSTGRTAPDAGNPVRLVQSYGQLPLSFEVNQGQTDARVNFISRGKGYTLFLTPTEAALVLRNGKVHPASAHLLRMTLLDADENAMPDAVNPLPGKVNYFVGSDPARWRTAVPLYAKVAYRNVYRGVDLIYHGNQRRLEYDFVIAPGRDPGQVRFGIDGAECVRLNETGDLLLEAPGGTVCFHKPELYQEIDGQRITVAGGYEMRSDKEIGFAVGSYDATRPLIIDPVLLYSTYLGGSDDDTASGIAVDSSQNAYIAGRTLSADFPTSSAVQDELSGPEDAFVTALDSTGSTLVYSTYLGGDDTDGANAIAVDGSGNAYVAGATSSTNFPTLNALQGSLGGAQDGFVAKIDSDGVLLFSTYLGGAATDSVAAVALDVSNNVYLAGQTVSVDLPTTAGAYQTDCGTDGNCDFDSETASGFSDVFVTKLASDGSTNLYTTYIGGEGDDLALAIAVDGSGSAYVGGETFSPSFPVVNPADERCGTDGQCNGNGDAFVAKLLPDGSDLTYSTFLGGSKVDMVNGIAVDTNGNAYVVGTTFSSNFKKTVKVVSQATAIFGQAHGNADVFVAEIGPGGSNLIYSVDLGGSGSDVAAGLALTPSGYVVVTGVTESENFPTYQPITNRLSGTSDAFIIKLIPAGTNFVYSTYFGGDADDGAASVALDSSGNTYIAGSTASTNFPTVDPLQADNAGGSDAFVAKLSGIETDLGIDAIGSPDPAASGALLTYTITVTNLGPADAHNVLIKDVLPGFTSYSNSSVTATVDGRFLVLELGDIDNGSSTTITLDLLVQFPLTVCDQFNVEADEPDPNPDNSTAAPCIPVPVHDFAMTRVRSPKKVALGSTGLVKVSFQNRSPSTETIADLATLNNLVTLTVASLGTNCPAPVAVLQTPTKPFPINIPSKGRFTATYKITFNCANDPSRGTDDFSYTATVSHQAIDGLLDSHPEDDPCPRSPLPDGVDRFPNGKLHDQGCPSASNTDVFGS